MAYDPNYDPRRAKRLATISNTEFLANTKEFTANYRDVLNILNNHNKVFFSSVNQTIEKISNYNRLEMTRHTRDELNDLMWDTYNEFVKYLAVQKEYITLLQKPTVLPNY